MENKLEVASLTNFDNMRDELLCDICENYLSIAPIFYVENIGYTCGRCDKVKSRETSDPLRIRQVLYEKIARKIVFPCKYESNGCEQKLKWNDVKQHEDTCEFNQCYCYFSLEQYHENGKMFKCGWEGNCEDLFKHLEDVHFSKIVELPIKFESNENGELEDGFFLVKIEKKWLATIFLSVDDENCYFLVTASPRNEEILREKRFLINIKNTDEGIVSTSARKKILIKHNFDQENIIKYGAKINKSNLEFTNSKSYVMLYVQDENFRQRSFPEQIVLHSCPFCGKKNLESGEILICGNAHKFCCYCIDDDIDSASCKLCRTVGFTRCYTDNDIDIKPDFEPLNCKKCEWEGTSKIAFYSHCKNEGHFKLLDEYLGGLINFETTEEHHHQFLFDAQVFRLFLKFDPNDGLRCMVYNEGFSKHYYKFKLNFREKEHKLLSYGYMNVRYDDENEDENEDENDDENNDENDSEDDDESAIDQVQNSFTMIPKILLDSFFEKKETIQISLSLARCDRKLL